MTFGRKVIEFHRRLKPNWKIPDGIDLIFPFSNTETFDILTSFYNKYFSDQNERIYLFGINPGRFGAGLTGVPFTDPQILENKCGIPNSFNKRHEISSIFIYDIIEAYGGIESFYSRFYITSICPLGFLKDGKNWNYYDDRLLARSVEKHIVCNIQEQTEFGCDTRVAYSIGKGKNFAYFKRLNDQFAFFDEVRPLPHPRWVMQYKLKNKEAYIDEYLCALENPDAVCP